MLSPFVHDLPIPPSDPAGDAMPVLDRGIYVTPWYFRGRHTLIVIDHTHACIHYEPVTDYGDRDAQVDGLRAMLLEQDPVTFALLD